jgi:hypothetical protein
MTLARVGHLETLFRVPDAASPLPGRLEEIGRGPLPGALALAVERAVPDSGDVVVLRRVDLGLVLDEGGPAGAEALAERWAEAAGAAVASVVDAGGDRDVVRFADEAHFVAAFVRDLLSGRAWDMWCYGAFAHLRALPLGAAVARVLRDGADVLSPVLRLLRRDDALDAALSTLEPEEARSIWQSALAHRSQPLDAASALPIAAAALRIAGRLGLVAGAAPEPAQLAAGHRRWAPQSLDWSSPAALADGVCGALVELIEADPPGTPGPALRERVASAVADLEWLDRGRLVDDVVSLLDPGGASVPTEREGETAALRRAIEAAAREAGLGGPGSDGDAPTALRLLGALAERDPELAARPDALSEIERLLAASGRGSDDLAASPPARIAITGEAPEASAPWRRCEAAGVMLLARSLSDTRLAALASSLGVPAPGLCDDAAAALVLSVGLAVAGPAGVDDDELDPALVALAGRDDAITLAELATAWSATDAAQHRTLRAELAGLARGQRLDRPRPVPDCCHPALPGLARGTAARAAHLALGAWARWLEGLSGSTPAFLLGQLLRRGGSVGIDADAVRVVLDPRPLDAVVELAGYFEPLERVPWLGERTLYVERGEA